MTAVDDAYGSVARAAAVIFPLASIAKSDVPTEFSIESSDADCEGAPRTVSAVALELVASTVRTEFVAGVVVPIAD